MQNDTSHLYATLADAEGLSALAGRVGGGAGEALLRDGEDISTANLLRHTSRALGRPERFFPIPAGVLRLAGAMIGKSAVVARLLDSLVVDDGKIRRHLGWTPPFTLSQGLSETAAWFQARGEPR